MPHLHPLIALAASILLVVFLIGWCRLHAFFALLLGALVVALTTGTLAAASSVEQVLKEMGALAGSIGYSIAVAAVIGAALMESGAADRIVRTFIRALGERRAPLALLGSGFVLGVPVFFDTVFFLLIPLARALSARTGGNYLLHVMAICAGAVITHATVPPTPGPLAMGEILRLDTGMTILAGGMAGLLPAAAGRDESSLPGFMASIAPVIVPVLLIAAVSISGAYREQLDANLWGAVAFLGNKNVALSIGALIAVGVYLRQTARKWRDTGVVVGEPLGTAGVIILITAAGGAYGAMIRASGVGDILRDWMSHTGASPVILAWALAALIRAAQGSTTVAVITTAGLVTSLGGAEGLGVNPLFLYLAIGYGGLFLSWMNDSGFWLYSRMSGMTEGETLRSWSMLLSLISVVGLAEAWLLSVVFR